MSSSTSNTSMAIIGDGSVGKSAIINAFKSEGFLSQYKQTVGFEVYEKKVYIRNNIPLSIQIWDIGGQSISSKNLNKYLSSAKVVFIVYDTTNTESFANLDDWLSITKKYTTHALIYLIGNKIDLIALRQISQTLHDKFIEENHLQGGFFFSAKTGDGILKSFYQAAGESVGTKLSPHELAQYETVVRAHIKATGDDEGRTAFADEIEAQDRAAQERSKKKGCVCS